MSDFKKLIGKKIKQIRKSKNLTQEKLAELINIEIPSMSYIETGKFAPSTETLQKLSEVLEVAPWEFYYFDTLSQEEMISELNVALKNNQHLTEIVYNFYKSLEFSVID